VSLREATEGRERVAELTLERDTLRRTAKASQILQTRLGVRLHRLEGDNGLRKGWAGLQTAARMARSQRGSIEAAGVSPSSEGLSASPSAYETSPAAALRSSSSSKASPSLSPTKRHSAGRRRDAGSLDGQREEEASSLAGKFRESLMGQLFGAPATTGSSGDHHHRGEVEAAVAPARREGLALSVVGALSPSKLLLRGGEGQRIRSRMEGTPLPKLFESYMRSP